MRAVSLVPIAFGLALAAGVHAQTPDKAPASAKTAASAKATTSVRTASNAKAAPAKAKSSVHRKAGNRTSSRTASAAGSAATAGVASAAAAHVIAGAQPSPVAQASGGLLGPATGEGQAAVGVASLALAPQLPKGQVTAFNPYGFAFPPGIYRCDLDRSVDVTQVASDLTTATVQWDKKTYVLRAVGARTGALRYEDAGSGLVWLIIAGKSMLLDTKNGKQLANDCRV